LNRTLLPCPISRFGENMSVGSGLIIIDDWFPNLLSGFRVAEFVHHLRMFPGLKVICTHPAAGHHLRMFSAIYPDIADRVILSLQDGLSKARAAWFIFLNNAYHWVSEMESRSVPFGFTLYPGGGFNLNDLETKEKLHRVLSSPMLRSVIVTQPISQEIL